MAQNCSGGMNVGTFGTTTTITSSQNYTTGSKTSTNTICLRGTIILNANVSIYDAHIVMDDDASITVSNGITLTINNSWFESCDNVTMWNEIRAGAGEAIVISNSLVEDGKQALLSDGGGSLQATNTEFNKNYIGIYLQNSTSSTSPLSVQACVFSCVEPAGSNNQAQILEELSGNGPKRSKAGISSDMVYKLSIGDAASSTYLNTFYKINQGIALLKTNASIYNNLFNDIQLIPSLSGGSPVTGRCIYIYDCGCTNNFDVLIGDQGLYKNTFVDCAMAIQVLPWTNLTAKYNELIHCLNGISVYNMTIPTSPTVNTEIRINNNSFFDCQFTGGFTDIRATCTRTSVFEIKNNEFNDCMVNSNCKYSPAAGHERQLKGIVENW